MTDRNTVSQIIRRARELIGITQAEVAELAGFQNLQTISDIERAQREVRSWELVRLARALRTTVPVLLGLAPLTAPGRVFWRRGGLAGHHPELEDRFRDRVRRYSALEELCQLTPAAALPDLPFDPETATYPDVERFASDVARLLDLGSRPASALGPVLEGRFRVKILYEDLEDGESAASLRGEHGAAILMNRREAPWRRNYNLAHELFHLVTWSAVEGAWPADGEPSWYEQLEKLANSFAADLLLPADEVAGEVNERLERGPLQDADLVEIARDFDVSSEALVWRLVNLRFFSADVARERLSTSDFRRLDRLSTKGLWGEPPPAGLPPRYIRLVRLAYEKGALSRVRAAEFLEQNTAELYDLDWAEIDEEAAAPPS